MTPPREPFLRYLALLLFFLQAPLLTKAAEDKHVKALLWEVSGNGLQHPSYIYGTIHAICPEQFVLSDQVKESLQKAEQLSFEVDMDAPNFMAELMRDAVLPKGKSLQGMFRAEDYQLLSDYFAATMNMDLKMLDNMKPFMLQSLLLSQLTECRATSYEQRLMEMAHAQGKEVTGLETIREQFAAMDKLPEQTQLDMLMKTVRDMPEAKASYRQMVALYLAQDLHGLSEITKKDLTPEEYALYEEAFLISRNKNWIPVIEREAKARATFFAVGAGHLPGKEGVLELLRRQGYTVTPVH
ncbi:MAG: TraB/GumN family protein [Hymenobacteraceae bacterium]|nr:TraB/GumN family protein [Hymenobacteraceae bacterium]